MLEPGCALSLLPPRFPKINARLQEDLKKTCDKVLTDYHRQHYYNAVAALNCYLRLWFEATFSNLSETHRLHIDMWSRMWKVILGWSRLAIFGCFILNGFLNVCVSWKRKWQTNNGLLFSPLYYSSTWIYSFAFVTLRQTDGPTYVLLT